jgi:putative nucleotidyltransferase with HDIG domain
MIFKINIFAFLVIFLLLTLTTIIFFRCKRKFIHLIKKLKEIQKIISESFNYSDLNSLLNFVAYSITNLLNAEKTLIYILNQNTQILQATIDNIKIHLKVGEGIAGYVAKTAEIVNIKDAYKDKRFLPLFDQKANFTTYTVLAVPIYDTKNNLIVGVVEVLNKKDKKIFTKEDENILKTFSSTLGGILSTIKLCGESKELFESFIKSFATAVDAKDPATKGHSLRVVKYALNIAKALNLSEKEMNILKYAAILHDVGKIGIPDNILSKGERFTEEEYEIMKRHVEITKEILNQIHFPQEYIDVQFIASTHHEFLDGSGYPNGLKNEQIPILSRILCIADIFDALTSYDRPYKPPYSLEQAIQILKQMADEGKIDKEILDLFISKKLYQIERREYVRINRQVAFSWRKLTPEEVKALVSSNLAKTLNISPKGLQFISKEELNEETYLEVELYLPNYTINVIAKVVYCKKEETDEYKVGVCFVNLSKETEKFLDQYLTLT